MAEESLLEEVESELKPADDTMWWIFLKLPIRLLLMFFVCFSLLSDLMLTELLMLTCSDGLCSSPILVSSFLMSDIIDQAVFDTKKN